MRSCEKMSSARSRAGWLRNRGAPSSAPSTTKRSWPECVASPALIASSMRASTFGVKMRRSRQRCSSRCLAIRLMPMLPAPRCAAAAEAATAATEATAVAGARATAAPVAAATAAAARPAAAAAAAAARRHKVDQYSDHEHKYAESQRRADIAPQEPGQRGDEAAGCDRAKQPPQRGAQHAADHEHDEDQGRMSASRWP